MIFTTLPVLDKMIEFYELPLEPARFQTYIKMLSGGKNDELVFPIGAYNPMAKSHVLERLVELKSMNAEANMEAQFLEFNDAFTEEDKDMIIHVGINLADDLKGGWTNRYSTEFDQIFKINALVERNFCTPILWSSEPYSQSLIENRTKAYIARHIHYREHGRVITLQEHFDMEKTAASYAVSEHDPLEEVEKDLLLEYLAEQGGNEDYATIFNFFMGDEASEHLGYKTFGIPPYGGFRLAYHTL